MYEKELAAVSHFNISAKPNGIIAITHGNINRTYQIAFDNGESWVLQNINVNVFKTPYELMDNVMGVCAHLKKKAKLSGDNPDKCTMTFAYSDDGTTLYVDEDNNHWRMSKFIDAVSYQSIARPELFYSAAEAFGHFQALLSDYPAETLCETIPNFHNTVSRYNDFRIAYKKCSFPERKALAKAEAEFLLSREELAHIAVDAIESGKMPLRVTHNDTKLNNVLIDKATDKGMCVIDLDTVMPGSVLYDFGDAIRFGACTTAEDDPDTSRIAVDLGLFEQFTKGFIKGLGGSLTDCEYDLLAEGALLMTYELCLRFLGDYFNGDVYFKLNYPEHNLVRARAQIALLRDMEKKLPDMKAIVEACRS